MRRREPQLGGGGRRGTERVDVGAGQDPLAELASAPREPLLPVDTPLTGGYLVGRIQTLDAVRSPIFGAIIEVQGRTVLSSFDGRFKLSLKGLTMPLTVHIRAEGYWRSTETLSLTHTPESPRLVANFRLPHVDPREDRAPRDGAYITPESLPPQLTELEWLLLHRGVEDATASLLGVTPTLDRWLAETRDPLEPPEDPRVSAWMSCFSERLGDLLSDAETH